MQWEKLARIIITVKLLCKLSGCQTMAPWEIEIGGEGMQFNSIEFLCLFLPLFLAIYYIFPAVWRKYLLIFGSLLFYGFSADRSAPWLGLVWLGVLLLVTLATWFLGRLLEKPGRGWLLGLTLGVLFSVLAFCKVFQGGAWLPPGMSFYLFGVSAYLIDVYRGRLRAETNLGSYTAGVVMFPKLLSGPIANPASLQYQMDRPRRSLEEIYRGLGELILGLSMKVILGDRLGSLWAQARTVGYDSISPGFAWLALLAFALRLYLDFWGYSLMAMGLGRMLGFHLPRNFREPYRAKSVSEFYRRWHITLNQWFREYLYIPLGGNRKGTARTMLNLAIVWAATGFWHGVGGNYLIWAAFLCLLMINERLWLGKFLEKSRVLCHIYTIGAILLSWVPFAIGDLGEMTVFLGKLFGLGTALNPGDALPLLIRYGWLLLAGCLLATPLPRKVWQLLRRSWVGDAALFVLFWVVVYFLATSAQDPFQYFQF